MARYTDAKCRLCRREGEKLFLKGTRCLSSKCAIDKRPYPPGQHGQGRHQKMSTYGQQLREKQKTKRTYGILERQFRRYFFMADRFRGLPGTVLLQLLERRLDNIVYRLGIASSRAQSRQLVCHGHIHVNGRQVNIPSYLIKPGETVSLSESSRTVTVIASNLENASSQERLSWIEWNPESFSGKILTIPSREDIPTAVNEQLIVELYSK